MLFFAIAVLCKGTNLDFYLGGYQFVYTLSIICSIIGFAYRYSKIRLKDISYPIYLYHMVVVNVMISLGWTGKKIYLLIAIILSVALAVMSTKLIGQKAK